MNAAIVDVHSHLYPRSYVELLKARTQIPKIVGEPGDERFVIFPEEDREDESGGRPMGPEYFGVAEKLAFMDSFGITQSVVSLGNPWLDPFGAEESFAAARALNAELARLSPDTDGRIVGMAVLPTDVDDAVVIAAEVAESSVLGGIVSGPRICGLTLDDEALEPLWDELARSSVPLLIHPHYAAAVEDLRGFGHALPVALGFPFETTIAIARLVLAGVLGRHPELRIVASHGGGTLPYLAGRLDAAWASDPNVKARLAHPPSEDLARLFVDAVLYHPRALRAAADLVGVTKIVFGTDHPFSVADPQANLDAIDATCADDDRESVLHRNAEALFRSSPT
jgi:predicted TIM-barrel fold metal-dependent hydrolase